MDAGKINYTVQPILQRSQVFTIYNNMLVMFYTNTGGAEALIVGNGDIWWDELEVESVNLSVNKVIPRCIAGQSPLDVVGIIQHTGSRM